MTYNFVNSSHCYKFIKKLLKKSAKASLKPLLWLIVNDLKTVSYDILEHSVTNKTAASRQNNLVSVFYLLLYSSNHSVSLLNVSKNILLFQNQTTSKKKSK